MSTLVIAGETLSSRLFLGTGGLPRPDLVRPAVRQIVERRGGRMSGRRFRQHVEVLVVALDEIEGARRREVLAVVARDVADLDP